MITDRREFLAGVLASFGVGLLPSLPQADFNNWLVVVDVSKGQLKWLKTIPISEAMFSDMLDGKLPADVPADDPFLVKVLLPRLRWEKTNAELNGPEMGELIVSHLRQSFATDYSVFAAPPIHVWS